VYATETEDDGCEVIVASGSEMYGISIDLRDEDVERGKSNVLRPTRARGETTASASRFLDSFSTGREIQSISLSANAGKLLAVDNFGVVDVMTRDVGAGTGFTSRAGGVSSVGASDVSGVGGWCGAVMDAEEKKMYVAKSSSQAVDVYDGDRRVRRIRTLLTPSDLSVAVGGKGESVFAVVEGHQLAVYDDRIAEKGGCTNRISLGYNKPLFAVSTSQSPGLEFLVACGGAERVVHILDIRKWGAMHRWRNATKFDITQLELSSSSPGFAYVAGLDYECMCGNWVTHKTDGGFSFRADSRWMGLHSCKTTSGDGDILAGWSESGHVYALRTTPRNT
jgi:DNA-binding beta-propeller fold protein YncE